MYDIQISVSSCDPDPDPSISFCKNNFETIETTYITYLLPSDYYSFSIDPHDRFVSRRIDLKRTICNYQGRELCYTVILFSFATHFCDLIRLAVTSPWQTSIFLTIHHIDPSYIMEHEHTFFLGVSSTFFSVEDNKQHSAVA